MNDEDRQLRINEAEWEKSSNWRFLFFYYSEKDSRPWVPKRTMYGRTRFGGTPNLARKTARMYLALIAGGGLLIFLLVVSMERSGILP